MSARWPPCPRKSVIATTAWAEERAMQSTAPIPDARRIFVTTQEHSHRQNGGGHEQPPRRQALFRQPSLTVS